MLQGWYAGKCLTSGFFCVQIFKLIFFFSFLNVLFHCLTLPKRVIMFGALIVGNNFFPYKSHRKLTEMWRSWPWRRWHSKLVSNHSFTKLYCLARFLSFRASGQHCFYITVKKCQKLYKLNEFYCVRRWRWIKVTFLKIQILWYCTRILCRIKSLHRVIIILPGTYWKIAAVFQYPFFCKFQWHLKYPWRRWR